VEAVTAAAIFFEMQFYDRPLRRAEDDKGYAAAGLVLLVAHQFRVLERSV
jgi:hypothetical protein